MKDLKYGELLWMYRERKTGILKEQYGLKGLHLTELSDAFMRGIERNLRYVHAVTERVDVLESELAKAREEIDMLKKSYEFRLQNIEAKLLGK